MCAYTKASLDFRCYDTAGEFNFYLIKQNMSSLQNFNKQLRLKKLFKH